MDTIIRKPGGTRRYLTERPLAAVLAVLSLPAASVLAAPPEPGPLAVKVVEGVVLPGYEALAATTAAQAADWKSACADGDFARKAPALRERYQAAAADAWAAVENVTTGPIGESLRGDRIFFGPDKRNYVSKAVAELLSRAKAGELAPDAMRSASVAGQGFPALERVLFEPPSDTVAGCRVGAAIARNLSTISANIVTEWKAPDGPLARLKRGEGDTLHFADPAQASARLITDLAGGLQRANDLKLSPVMGGNVEAAKPKSAEGWRSGRSARALGASVASLAATAKIFASAAPADVSETNGKAFDLAQASVARLPADFGDAAADPKRRKALEATVAAVKAAQADVAKNLAPALGLPLGFNSLDGD